MLEPKIKYVRADETLGEKVASTKKDGLDLTTELENKILALPDTDETKTVKKDNEGDLEVVRTVDNKVSVVKTGEKCNIDEKQVQRILKSSRARAREVLKQLHSEGKIKTESERYAELHPSKDVDLKEVKAK